MADDPIGTKEKIEKARVSYFLPADLIELVIKKSEESGFCRSEVVEKCIAKILGG